MAEKFLQSINADIKKRGTQGVCTGDNFGGPTCPEGSKRYNLAKLFHRFAQEKVARTQDQGEQT